MTNRLFSAASPFSICNYAKSLLSAFASFFIIANAVIFVNGCKPTLDPNAKRTDYIRILDIGSAVSVHLENTLIQTPPIRMIKSADGNLALISTVSLPFGAATHFCIQLTKISFSGNILWTHIYQDSGANLIANDLTLSQNGFLIASTRISSSNQNAAILGTNENGDSLWFKKYQTKWITSSNCLSSVIVPTQDGRFLVSGTYTDPKTTPSGATYGPFLQFINLQGDSLKMVLGTANIMKLLFSSNAIDTTNDGSFLMIGSFLNSHYSEPNFYKIQSDSFIEQAIQNWPQSHFETIHSITGDNSNGFVLFGDSIVNQNATSQSAVIYHIPDDGTYLRTWSHAYAPGDQNSFTSGIHTRDGGYMAAGYSVTRSDTSIFIAKIDGTGNPQWSKTYPGSGDQATSVLQVPDGTYIVAGVTTSFGGRGGTNQVFIMRLNENGDYVN